MIDDTITHYLRLNKRGNKTSFYIEVEGRNRDIRREAIGRRINHLEREGIIYIIRKEFGEDLYGLSDE